MNDTQKEFEDAMMKKWNDSNSPERCGDTKTYWSDSYECAWQGWQACQNLNNERISKIEADAKCMQWIEQNCKDYGTHIEIRIADLKGSLRDAIIEQLKT